MLDTATKRRIDTARDILVGKVPDPKSQVEQITIALIYKFMDDMDAEAEELGGKRSFFAGDFARYGWAKLLRSGLGGHEMLGLYAEAITRMPENPGVPALFRDIFKNAYLPYRDPETLRAFLKIIDEFDYDHSERLGDAFEYLLSVLGSQGDAGQFRTPRHIIDFIVAILDPKKGETILDPACGTAGFLISAWKHIQAANRDTNGESTLSPDEQERLASNIRGYDISPDMVRLSLANMYLHGFNDPHIVEYDTLTSDERWNEFADVILANPPFMSPKGGIRPHNRFSIQSNRSEVLFVDYMAEHLTPNGRAGIIVPEGVIFQSGKAYKALRKELVEKYLVAVVSLPAGVFNPYSGVKTSILILDRAGAKASDTIGFFKIVNDGFGLGAQRREVKGGELPEMMAEIAEYRTHCGEKLWQGRFGHAVVKADIASSGDYNFSGERYRASAAKTSAYPIVALGDFAEIRMGETLIKGDLTGSGMPIFSADRSERPWAYTQNTKLAFGKNTVVIGARGTIGSVKHPRLERFTCTQTTIAITPKDSELESEFLASLLRAFDWKSITEGVGIPMITVANVRRIEIPLPPPNVQREIVAEIDSYQKVIDGARAVVENYRPHIVIDLDWPLIRIGDVAAAESGFGFPLDRQGRTDEEIPFLKVSDMNLPGNEIHTVRQNHTVAPADIAALRAKVFPAGTVVFPKIGAAIATNKKRILARPSTYDNNVMGIVPNIDVLTSEYLYYHLMGVDLSRWASTAEPPSMKKSTVEDALMPLPSIDAQHAVVGELEAERTLVEANRELIERMEKKIEAAIARVWGAAAETPDAPEVLAAE